jgi:flavin-dependent dehydrogenase
VEKRRGEGVTLSSRSPICAMTVRQELDHYCLRQTLAAGAQFARIGAIVSLHSDDHGVTLTTEDSVFRGSFLVGADGVHSRVRHFICGDHPAWFRRGFALEAEVRFADQPPSDLIFDLGSVRRGYAWIFPRRDHLNVGIYTEAPDEKIDRARLLAWTADRFNGVASAEPISGQYLGFGAEGFEAGSAPPAEGRVFLVGDAGGFADPLTGEGIYGAIASGQAAASAIDTALSEGTSAAEVFALHTRRLRRDLRLSASGARWFSANFDLGFRALTAPVFRSAIINAYSSGTKIASLANAVRRFAWMFAIHA